MKCPLHLKYVPALPWEIWSARSSRQSSIYMYILMNHWISTNTADSYCLEIVKRVVSYIIFTLHPRNVCLQHECEHVDDVSMSPTARSLNSMIQTVHLFLMRRLSSSTSEILVRAGGRHFEHVMYRWCNLLHVVTAQSFISMYTLIVQFVTSNSPSTKREIYI